jgi:RNA polymerase sigma factor (sigma-70 family)
MSTRAPTSDDPGQGSAPDPPSSWSGPLDEAAFDALYRQCVADVHGYVISLLGDRSAAEDVTAMAFERLFRTRTRLDQARGTPRAWLFAVARNAAIDELRRLRRQPQCELDERPSPDPEAERELEHVERRRTVRDALSSLPLRERELVLLKFHGQLSNAELAQALGISESNAGTRLHRALTRLRTSCIELDRQEVA